MDNPWLMFRCWRLLLFESIAPRWGSAHCCSLPMDGKAHAHRLCRGEQGRGPGASIPLFPTGLPALLCAGGDSQPTAGGKEGIPRCRAGRAGGAGAASSTLCSTAWGLLARKEPPEGDQNHPAKGHRVGQGIGGSWKGLHPSLSWSSHHCLERGGSHSVKIWRPLHIPQIQFQGKMTPRQEKGGFSPGKKFKPHAGRLAAVAGGGTGAAREQALSSQAKRKVN